MLYCMETPRVALFHCKVYCKMRTDRYLKKNLLFSWYKATCDVVEAQNTFRTKLHKRVETR